MKKFKKITATCLAALISASALVLPASAATVRAVKLGAQSVSSGVKLSWGKNSGAAKFVISRKAKGAAKYTAVKTITNKKAVSFTDKTAKAGVEYTYRLAAVNGGASAVSTARAMKLSAPQAPTVKVKYSEYGEGIFKLSWKKVSGAKSYSVYRASVKNGKVGKFKFVVSTKKTKANDYNHGSGYYFVYKVMAKNGSFKSSLGKQSRKVMNMDGVGCRLKIDESYKGVKITWHEYYYNAEKFTIYRSENGGKFKPVKSSSSFKREKEKLYEGMPDEFAEYCYYYVDKTVKKDVKYTYYVVGETDGKKSRVTDYQRETITFRDYDEVISIGDNKDLLMETLSAVVNSQASYSDYTLKSSDESVFRIKTSDKNGMTWYSMVGVSEGYADLIVESVFDLGDGANTKRTERFRIKVVNGKAYDVVVKKGDVFTIEDINFPDGMSDIIFLVLRSMEFRSENPDIIKVSLINNDDYTFDALKKGDALLTIKFLDEDLAEIGPMTDVFRILLTLDVKVRVKVV